MANWQAASGWEAGRAAAVAGRRGRAERSAENRGYRPSRAGWAGRAEVKAPFGEAHGLTIGVGVPAGRARRGEDALRRTAQGLGGQALAWRGRPHGRGSLGRRRFGRSGNRFAVGALPCAEPSGRHSTPRLMTPRGG